MTVPVGESVEGPAHRRRFAADAISCCVPIFSGGAALLFQCRAGLSPTIFCCFAYRHYQMQIIEIPFVY
jgi:hypothetical protein